MGIQVQISREIYIYAIQVYLPSSKHSIVRFQVESQSGRVILMGDFNAHLNGNTFIKQIDRIKSEIIYWINLHIFLH